MLEKYAAGLAVADHVAAVAVVDAAAVAVAAVGDGWLDRVVAEGFE